MEACCECKQTHFSIPYDKPLSIIVCHCDACKIMSGSTFYVAAAFPAFEFPPPEAKSSLSKTTRESEANREIIGWFCKGCGNRMAHTVGGMDKAWVSVSVARLVGFDWATLKDKNAVTHIWTKQAVNEVPEGFKAFEEQPVFAGVA